MAKKAKTQSKNPNFDAARVAQMHFHPEHPMNQAEIGKELGMDKSAVSRLIKYAREARIVDFVMNLPREERLELELLRKFGLTHAAVIPLEQPRNSDDFWHFSRELGRAAARYLENNSDLLKNNLKIGISCGTTMRNLIMALTPRKYKCMQISQLCIEGEWNIGIAVSPFALVSMLLGVWDDGSRRDDERCAAYAIQPLPGTLCEQREEGDGETVWTKTYAEYWSEICNKARDLDLVLVGISACNKNGGGTFFQIAEKHGIAKDVFLKNGVVGEICNRVYDRDGEDLSGNIRGLQAVLDGIELDVLKNLVGASKPVIAVAGGEDKAEAIHAALKQKCVNCLVTDSATAKKICEFS